MPNELRAAYAKALINEARINDRIVVLEADLMGASGTKAFKNEFPSRLINVGVAEATMVGMAAGLSINGFIPFADTFGTFASRRAFDQFFISGAYAKTNIKLVGTDPGVGAQYNGGTHMPFEDTGMMRLVPELVIVEPSDSVSAGAFVHLLAEHKGCTYMRLHRKGLDDIYDQSASFSLGQAKVLREGDDVVIFAFGAIPVHEALKVADILKDKGISITVVDLLSIKPLDVSTVISYAKKAKYIFTSENNQIQGGVYSLILETLNENNIFKKVNPIGVHDKFGQVGDLEYLKKAYGMDKDSIVEYILKIINK